MWVEFVVGSLLCSEKFFSCNPVFSSPQKPTFPNFNSIRNQVDEDPVSGCARPLNRYLFYYIEDITWSREDMNFIFE